MAERKVLIKYYPPDFNPALLPKNHRPRDKQDNVRNMLPMTIRCNTCGNYLYIGTKFNMRRETVWNENYLGIRIHRFYFKCTYCYSEITFKTDPKNHDYIVEEGGARNYDPFRDARAAEDVLKELRAKEEFGDSMKFLENKTCDSKKEMDILDALDDIEQLNKRYSNITPDDLLRKLFFKQNDELLDEQIGEELHDQFRVKRILDEQDETRDKYSVEIYKNMQSLIKNEFGAMKGKIISDKQKIFKPIFKKVKNEDGSDSQTLKQEDDIKVKVEVKCEPPQSNNDIKIERIKVQQAKKLLTLCNYSDNDD